MLTEAEAAIFLPCLVEKVPWILKLYKNCLLKNVILYAITVRFHDQILVALQSGHNIEKVREKMGELIKQMVNIYSLPKLLPYTLEGLRSKNNRTRIECVDIIGYFIDHHGTEV